MEKEKRYPVYLTADEMKAIVMDIVKQMGQIHYVYRFYDVMEKHGIKRPIVDRRAE